MLAGIFLGAYGHETACAAGATHAAMDPLAKLLDAVAQVRAWLDWEGSLEPGDVRDTPGCHDRRPPRRGAPSAPPAQSSSMPSSSE